ncbi:4401_t:CDS:1, partial [Scutellospora calospora]
TLDTGTSIALLVISKSNRIIFFSESDICSGLLDKEICACSIALETVFLS